MGDEIKDARKIVGRAAIIAGGISIILYLLGTTSLLIAVSSTQIGAIQGLMQAVAIVAMDLHLLVLVPVIASLLALAVLGVSSAWIAGAARIPFVMGLGVYLPPSLGKTHEKWGTPYVALIVQALLSTAFICISLYGTYVREAYEFLLKSSVIIQLVPFLYLFLGLWKLGKRRLFAMLGTISTAFGILFVFIPSAGVEHKLRFELQLLASCFLMLGVAVVFYLIGKRKQAALLRIQSWNDMLEETTEGGNYVRKAVQTIYRWRFCWFSFQTNIRSAESCQSGSARRFSCGRQQRCRSRGSGSQTFVWFRRMAGENKSGKRTHPSPACWKSTAAKRGVGETGMPEQRKTDCWSRSRYRRRGNLLWILWRIGD